MKNIFKTLAVAVLAAFTLASCTGAAYGDNTAVIESLVEETAQVYGVDLRFDAPADLSEATVQFFDGHGQHIAVNNITVPATSAETVSAVFLAEAEPEYIFTNGLQNVGDNGLLAIPKSSVSTRSGGDAALLVIRFNE